MKKVIKANNSVESLNIPEQTADTCHPGLESISVKASRHGYVLEHIPGTYFDFTLTCEEEPDKMPVITVATEYEASMDVVYMTVRLEFPELASADTDYVDTVEYYITKWREVGQLVTYMHRNPFSPHYNDYAEYEELDY